MQMDNNCSQRQEAGVSGLYLDVNVQAEIEPGKFHSFSIHIDIGTLYFSMPYKDVDCEQRYTNAYAATTAANAINSGFGLVRSLVIDNYETDGNYLKSRCIQRINSWFGGNEFNVSNTPQIQELSGNLKSYKSCD
jgi:hypothetical protein